MTEARFWVVREDWRTLELLSGLARDGDGIQLANEKPLNDAWASLVRAKTVGYYGNPVILPGFLQPKLYMPERGFSPDYFTFGLRRFASQRLREAFALPESAVQYLPTELLRGGPEVRARNYRWMNILACHPAIDLQRSIYETEDGMRHATGEKFQYIRSYTRMVFRDDIDPGAEIFRVADDLVTVLATDALAERVMRAGCTGIAFEDPATFCARGPIHRYRAATGIVEEDMEKILPPIR